MGSWATLVWSCPKWVYRTHDDGSLGCMCVLHGVSTAVRPTQGHYCKRADQAADPFGLSGPCVLHNRGAGALECLFVRLEPGDCVWQACMARR